ncbi:hypothetical protein [Chitinophaga barathri]|uniref:hypothetical protein n=1 Tax=Chitinophaga barathri TaxID=1647451 RepID=UPI0013C45D92|nr:hypothetical protein [Chitinophaga barathri]
MKVKIIIRPPAAKPDAGLKEVHNKLGYFMKDTLRLPETSEIARRKYKPASLPMQLPPF